MDAVVGIVTTERRVSWGTVTYNESYNDYTLYGAPNRQHIVKLHHMIEPITYSIALGSGGVLVMGNTQRWDHDFCLTHSWLE